MATSIRERHTGAEYFHYITSVESDRRARAAFLDLVLRLAPPGGALIDFGAGPGIDAKFLAQRGFSVRAYDVDPRMCDFFAAHCADFIAAGRIVLERGNYREFLERAAPATRADLIISNFAPLNLIPDPHELFAKFHDLTVADGKVFASVINPYFVDELRNPRSWPSALRLWREGHYYMPGPQAPHMRRRPADFQVLSSPYFKLVGVFRGLPARRKRPLGGRDSWLRLARSRFMFLLFEKNATRANRAGAHPLP
jgi:SAM-dependent methyltransferase